MYYTYLDGILRIFQSENDETPMLVQPSWPNGDEWLPGEAEAWAEQFILSSMDENALLAGPSREVPTQPRPTPEEVAAFIRKMPIQNLNQELLEEIIDARLRAVLGPNYFNGDAHSDEPPA